MNLISTRSHWILQRATGILLIALFATHVAMEWLTSAEADGVQGPVVGDQFFEIGISFSPLVYQIVAVVTLGILLYHGLNGVSNIVIGHSREFSPRTIRIINGLLVISGVVLFIQGVLIIRMVAGMQTGGV